MPHKEYIKATEEQRRMQVNQRRRLWVAIDKSDNLKHVKIAHIGHVWYMIELWDDGDYNTNECRVFSIDLRKVTEGQLKEVLGVFGWSMPRIDNQRYEKNRKIFVDTTRRRYKYASEAPPPQKLSDVYQCVIENDSEEIFATGDMIDRVIIPRLIWENCGKPLASFFDKNENYAKSLAMTWAENNA